MFPEFLRVRRDVQTNQNTKVSSEYCIQNILTRPRARASSYLFAYFSRCLIRSCCVSAVTRCTCMQTSSGSVPVLKTTSAPRPHPDLIWSSTGASWLWLYAAHLICHWLTLTRGGSALQKKKTTLTSCWPIAMKYLQQVFSCSRIIHGAPTHSAARQGSVSHARITSQVLKASPPARPCVIF